jgi:large subunit ribosomal protein L25
MKQTLRLKAEARQETGSKAAERLRKQGRIPAIVYGHKEEPVAISLNTHDFVERLHHGHRLMDLHVGRKPEKVIIKDLQYDHLGKQVIHADLMRVDVTETVTVDVPIELRGTAKGSEEGGIVEQHTDHLEVECRVTEIPESIVVSVKEMDVGDALYARDVGLPAGVKLISDPEALVATCRLVSAAKTTEELEEEAPVAPEVISEAEKPEQEPSRGQGQ